MVKRLRWYVHRLASMSSPEIRYRLRQQAVIATDRRRVGRVNVADIETAAAYAAFIAGDVPWFTDAIADKSSPWINGDVTIALAEKLLAHQIKLFGRQFELGREIDWHADPLTGRRWPVQFYAQLDTRDGQTVGGVKWVWELNRHHHLVTLAKAFYLTGDERFATEACAQIDAWITANPPYIGVNWSSALELALRLINWAWGLYFLRGSDVVTEAFFGRFCTSVAVQSEYIQRHLSAFSSANNHLIGEAAGLTITGMAFPFLPNAVTWRDHGLRILEAELPRQIYPDGVSAEQSPAYLAFVLDFNLVSWRLATLNGIQPPAIWHKRLSAACDYLRHSMDASGNVPAIGDSDDAWVVRLDDRPNANNYRAICATAAAMLHNSALKTAAGTWDEKSHWLCGDAGQAQFAALPHVPSPVGSRLFADGGYAIMRHNDMVVTMDCGPLGYLATAAHGHADALSLTLSVGATPVLVDAGTYAYQEGGAWRSFFCSTRAHNTIVVAGQDQSEMRGTFLWGRRAATRILDWQSTAEYAMIAAEHDGYRIAGVTHRRSVLFLKDPLLLVVVDSLYGRGNHHFEALWHFSAEAVVRRNGVTACVTCAAHTLFVVPRSTLVIGGDLIEAATDPIQGWVSSHYGHLTNAPVLVTSGEFHGSATLTTFFSFAPLHSLDIESIDMRVWAILTETKVAEFSSEKREF